MSTLSIRQSQVAEHASVPLRSAASRQCLRAHAVLYLFTVLVIPVFAFSSLDDTLDDTLDWVESHIVNASAARPNPLALGGARS